jgi:hypothetical protein
MKVRRSLGARIIFICVIAAGLASSWAAMAQAAPVGPKFVVKASWGPTNMPPGGEGQINLVARNVGDEAGHGALILRDELPEGVTAKEINGELAFFCSGAGTGIVTCSFPSVFVPFLTRAPGVEPDGVGGLVPNGYMQPFHIDVEISPSVGEQGENIATIEGGGAEPFSDVDQLTLNGEPTTFGSVPESFESDSFSAAYPFGHRERQAGGHPYEQRVNFDLRQMSGLYAAESSPHRYTLPAGRVKTVQVTLPRGMTGNPESLPKCSPADFASEGVGLNSTKCPSDSQVGVVNLVLGSGPSNFGEGSFSGWGKFSRIPIYNLQPPAGTAADFGFVAGGVVQSHIYATLDPAHHYAIKTVTPFITDYLSVRYVEVTFWGVPGDPGHDKSRFYPELHTTEGREVATGAPFTGLIRPFLTSPADCGEENGGSILQLESYNDPGTFTPAEEDPHHYDVEGCNDPRFRFDPKVGFEPSSRDAGAPTGLNVQLEVPQRDDVVTNASDLYAENGDVQAIATPPLKRAVVTLPEGMTISPSAAQGLGTCSSAEIGLGTDSPVQCPANSRYGQLTVHTPLLPQDEPMVGDIYIAKQGDNPFHNFLSMYFVIHDESRGLLIKIPGKIDLDPTTGQIKVTFDDLPQFPVSDLQMTFKGGVRAALVNPSTCGEKTIRAEFFTWQDPTTPHVNETSYPITRKPDGSPCVNSLGERPFKPQMQAGTVNPTAGAYSPFAFRLTRTDDDQEFSQLGVTLPPGLLAKIAGIGKCSDAAIAQAGAPFRTGTEEMEHPSCPASSQIGTTDVGAGVGVPLTYVPGKAYLAGPYHGAPLSMVVISPAVVGPYDLGVIVVRSSIDVNRETAQVDVRTDPFPQIFQGIPVRIRDIRVNIDRPETTLNPTNCSPMAVMARVTGTGGDVASTADDTAVDLKSRFQAANCADLGFKPKLTFRLKGGTHRGDFPALQATLRARPGDANLARTAVTLPHAEFLEQAHIATVCTRVQFNQDACPAGSVYGHASAVSPLFDKPLEGPVYLRSNGGERLLPDLVAKLEGEVEVVLQGYIDTAHRKLPNGESTAEIRNTFNVIPDAPVTRFSLRMKGGAKGLLVNSRDLCPRPAHAFVKMVGQNGKISETKPLLRASCRRPRAGHRHHG